ncbi:MAG: hypothetical protein Q9195_006530 [Heterodermia aff. obscurata]
MTTLALFALAETPFSVDEISVRLSPVDRMDAITILGTAGAVVNIIDLIGKSIKTLRDLRERWKDAEFITLNLITQLIALKAALSKISEWISSDLAYHPHHYQLVMDLGESIGCCKMLVKSMDDQLARLQCGPDDKLDLESRLRIVFEDKTSHDFQKYIKRQTNALTLLLVACNCKSMFEQKLLLENPISRQVFDNVKEDSSSVVVLADKDSGISEVSKYSATSSNMSTEFQFDSELFNSAVYQRAVRSMFRYPKASEKHSAKLLLLGARESGKELLMKQMKLSHHNENHMTELLCYKYTILSAVVDLLRQILLLIEEMDSENSFRPRSALTNIIWQQNLPLDGITPQLAAAMDHSLETILPLLPRIRQMQSLLPSFDDALYFLEHIPRITDPQYVPSETDILRLPAQYENIWDKSVQATRLSFGKLSMHVIGCSGDSESQRADWIAHFKDVNGVVFVVDLCSYDQALPSNPNNTRLMKCLDLINVMGTGRSIYTKLMESLYLFEILVNSRPYRNTSIFLIFTGIEELQLKMTESPLSEYFSDYDGGHDIDSTVEYILSLFLNANKEKLRIYSDVLYLKGHKEFQLDAVLESLSARFMPKPPKDERTTINRYRHQFSTRIASMGMLGPSILETQANSFPVPC